MGTSRNDATERGIDYESTVKAADYSVGAEEESKRRAGCVQGD